MRPRVARLILCALFMCALPAGSASADELTVFPARRIITMDPSMPTATVVAVREDRIVAVGTMDTLRPWLDAHDYEIDERLKDKVLLPGFIDPHLHPGLGASLLGQNEIIAPEDWVLPDRTVKGVPDRQSYLARLRELVERDPDSETTFFTWGWNSYWHGSLTRHDLDAISATRPIVVTQRSAHEVLLNTAALEAAHISEEIAATVPDGVDWDAGRFWERGQAVVRRGIAAYLRDPDAADDGLGLVADLIHRGGVTTISDPGQAPRADSPQWARLKAAFDTCNITT